MSDIGRWFIGLALTILVAVLVDVLSESLASSRSPDGGAGELLVVLAALVAVGFACGFIVRSWLSVVVIPLTFYVAVHASEQVTCPDCVGPTYDVGVVGALVYGIVGLSPMIVGAALGAFAGQRQSIQA